MITPFNHQIEKAEELWVLLRQKGYVYLAGKPRSGKTLTAILTAEKSSKISSVLVLTKKAAIPGWLKFTKNMKLSHTYKITNYEQVGRIDGKKFNLKLNPGDYQLVIIDESHNLGTLPKPSNRIKLIKKLCWNMPHIHLSGTAIVESPNSIYPQMTISRFSPFRAFKNFYDYFKTYGEPYYIKAAGRDIQQYDRAKEELLMPLINEFTVYMTQEDAGISSEVQATDKLHYITLGKDTKELYNTLQRHSISKVAPEMFKLGMKNIPDSHKYDLVCDSTMKLRTSLHMLESGVAKIDDEYLELGNTEKIDYIKKEFGDEEDIGIMCHFIGERILLAKHFSRASIYSSTSHAEGVDLSYLKHFIILSSDYSGSKFIQRRDRIVNITGSNTTIVNHILVKKAISEQVYKKVSKKEDFNNSTYEKETI